MYIYTILKFELDVIYSFIIIYNLHISGIIGKDLIKSFKFHRVFYHLFSILMFH